MVKFHASTTGSRIERSSVNGSTLGLMPLGNIGLPLGPLGCDARTRVEFSGGGVADVAVERVHIAEQEGGEREAGAVGSFGGGGIEDQLAGAVIVTGHAEILLVPDVDAEFDGVIAEGVGHVADPLELVLLLV